MGRSRSVEPSDLSVPLQVLFAEVTDDGLLVDCVVAHQVTTSLGRTIRAGEPFSLVMSSGGSTVDGEAVTMMLRRWSDEGCVVDAASSGTGRYLVLRHGAEELVLEVS
jgi:hypothetical protein